MIAAEFEYHRPASIGDAVALMGSLGEEARVVAGGHSLIPMMKLRMAVPTHLIDLQALDELRHVAIDGEDITLGALVTQSELIEHADLHERCPILRETALQIADPQIRNMGTVGGNVANGDPGNDLPALMQALDATYVLRGEDGERTVPAREFYEAAYFTAREEEELLTAIRLRAPAAGHGHAYCKQKRKIGDYATAAAAVLLEMEGGRCRAAAIALTNVADTPLHAEEAAAALVGSTLDAAAVDAAVEAAKAITDPAEDGRGPAEFRTHIAGVMVRRAIALAHERAG